MLFGSSFRHFCNEKWYEHLDEIRLWEGKSPSYGSEIYFHRNKWLLKNMYVEQFARKNRRKIQKELKRGMKKGNL